MSLGPQPPGATLEAFAEGFASGQAGGTLSITIDDGDGNNVVPQTTANIVEIEDTGAAPTFAVYRYLGVFPADPSLSPYLITWEGKSGTDPTIITTASEEIFVSTAAPTPIAGGPCDAWILWDDALACCDVTGVGTESQDELQVDADNATLILYMLSGERFTGLCGPITERPPGPGDCRCWQRWQYGDGTIGFVPTWDWTGAWRWPGGSCGCGSLSEVRLGNYPVQAINSVTIDGVVVAPSDYRVDRSHLLVRLNGGRWPTCQNMAVADDQPGAFAVSYWYGEDPPQLAKDAAARLACEFFKACNPEVGKCKLPAGTTKIVRAGITIDKASGIIAALLAGGTGMIEIDSFVSLYGVRPGSSPPQVWSPDRPWPRRTA